MSILKMKYYTYLLGLSGFLLVISCQSTKQWQLDTIPAAQIELGAIVQREGLLKQNAELKTLPALSEPLRVSISSIPATQQLLHKYIKLRKYGNVVQGGDSLSGAPVFWKIELIDDVNYAAMINENAGLRDYVKNAKNAGVITSIIVAGDDTIGMNQADIYFMESKNSHQVLSSYKDGNMLSNIPFSKLNAVSYQVSYFCFGKDALGRIQIMDIVEEGKGCKRPLERKPKNLTKTKRLYSY